MWGVWLGVVAAGRIALRLLLLASRCMLVVSSGRCMGAWGVHAWGGMAVGC